MDKLVKDSSTFISWIAVGAASLDGDRGGMSHDLTQKMTQLGIWLNSENDSTRTMTKLGKWFNLTWLEGLELSRVS